MTEAVERVPYDNGLRHERVKSCYHITYYLMILLPCYYPLLSVLLLLTPVHKTAILTS